MKYGLRFVDKTGLVSPEIAAKQIIFIALSYFKKMIKNNFNGNIINTKA